MSETDYSFEPEANDVLIEVDELVENPDIDIGEYDSSEEESVTGSLGGLQFDVIDSDSPTVYTTIDDVTPADYTCGTPGELPTPSTALVDADFPLNKIITVVTTNVEQIVEVNEDLIQFISDNNARVYAVLNDGTRVQCELSDVFDPEKAHAQVFVNQGLIIANVLKQHFWYDSNGAHVTDDEQDDWNEEYNKTGHGDLANPSLNRPWHNILINSYGLLIRKGLIWLSQHSVGSVLFYDGTGNTLNNVVAGFSTDGVQIGKLTEKHLIVDDNGLTAYDENGDIAPITAYLSGSYIEDSTITGSKIASSTIENSNIKDGTITGGKIIGSTLTGIPQAAIVNLSTDYAHVDDLTAATGRITTLETNTADIGTLRANSAKIANLTAQQLSAAVGYIADLTAGNITTTDLIADHGTIDSLDVNYAQVNMANVNNAWIENGTVKNGAISDAMINSVSANKLTAGTIDASNITVTNLNANNITTGTINGQRIGTGSLSLDKLSEDVYTETEVDNLLATMQSEIDGAIETWTGTAVPTLNNTPASGWSTNADKDKHVGDVYFVINSQSQQNGYNYRFTKSGNTYSWQLIKDTDITNALSRLSTAEGKITTFDSDITTLKTDTGTLKTKTQSLETSLGDKVDVTTFNDLEDTVDGHSRTISQHTTAISNKADGSTVTSLTNRVSKNEQDISGINTTIGELSTTVESKADGSTVETVSNRLSTVSDTVNGHTSQLSSITNTQTSIQGSAVKSTVQLWFTKANTTAPNKPTAHVTTNNASTANAWNLAVPTYNANYPNYYYCYEYEYLNGTYGWSAVTRDIATGEAQSTARTAASDASTAKTNASSAVSTANTANTNASNAVSTANAANTNASNAVSTANTAASDASTAKTNAATAVSTANTANTNASSAVTTANTAKSTADKNMRESQQLWFTKANSTAPGKPTSKVTSTATTGNAWTTKVPTYNASYKYYFYCMQYIAADGTVTWSDVIYDQATTEAQSVARAASADLTEFHQEYATFKQTTQNFESTVGETYATKTEMAESVKQHDSDTESPLVVGDNAATAPLRSYEGTGHAEQFTTTGKNLLENDGYFPISGTFSNSYYREFNANTRGLPRIEVQAGVTYTLSFDVESSVTPFMISVGLGTGVYSLDIAKSSMLENGRNTITFTPTAERIQQRGNVFSFRAPRYNSTKDFTYSVSNVQLEVGDTATAYEPYTGGAPSPSPDYPQEINVVRGRNLFDESKSTIGYRLDASGQLIPIANCATSDFIEVEAGGAYYVTNGMGSTIGRVAAFYDTSKAFVSAAFFNNSVVASGVITAPLNATYVRVDYLMPTHANYVGPMQLEEGSVATPYVPYGHVGLEAQSADASIYKEKTVIDGSGNEASNTSFNIMSKVVGAGHVGLSVDVDGVTGFGVRVHAYRAGVWVRQLAVLDMTTKHYAGALPDGADEIRYNLPRVAAASCSITLITPIPLPQRGWVAGVSDGTTDVLTLDSAGKVEWELNDAEVVLDGSEQWQAYNIYGYSCPAAGLIPNCKYAATGNTPVMSNLYQNRTPTWTDSSFGIENRIIWVGDRNSARFGSLAGFKTFLASTNLTILYPLATPIIEERGYIDMPQVSEGYTISIPELEDSGISWWCKASESMANVTTAIEKRVATAETSITQTKEQILLKANASDVYTKTQTDGLISTEVTNRNAAIKVTTDSITTEVAKKTDKTAIISTINQTAETVKIQASKVNITGDAVFSAINNDTGTTKISGGKIDATSITLGYSQITNTPSIPTKTSDLTNDSSYATTSQIPTKTSDLTNDSSYATTSQAQGYADAKDTAIAAAAKRTYVSIRATAVNYSANTATLEATLYIDGTAKTTGVTYVWMKDGTAISGATSRTYSVPASSGLNHAYSCKCTATV